MPPSWRIHVLKKPATEQEKKVGEGETTYAAYKMLSLGNAIEGTFSSILVRLGSHFLKPGFTKHSLKNIGAFPSETGVKAKGNRT